MTRRKRLVRVGGGTPRALRVFDRVATPLLSRSSDRFSLSEEALLRTARRGAGLDEFGDESFRPALRALLQSYEHEADLSAVGRIGTRFEIVRCLRNRLQIQAAVQRCPAILEQRISRPLVVVGLPRSGTTLLHGLLARDPAARVPRLWELWWPAPEQTHRGVPWDGRLVRATVLTRLYAVLTPQMRAIHALHADGAEECFFLLQNAFASLESGFRASLRGYVRWLLDHDLRPAYRFYHQQLQLLQWQRPGERWVLKSPVHLLALDALLEVLPDAGIVHVHRDPYAAIGSLCSLTALVRAGLCRRVDPIRLGEDMSTWWGEAWRRTAEVRRTAVPTRFHDVAYDDLLSNPIGVVRGIYRRFGYILTPGTEARMAHWLAAHGQHRHGVHGYRAEQFGLTREALEQQFPSLHPEHRATP